MKVHTRCTCEGYRYAPAHVHACDIHAAACVVFAHASCMLIGNLRVNTFRRAIVVHQ